jgi:hypothetical protein
MDTLKSWGSRLVAANAGDFVADEKLPEMGEGRRLERLETGLPST